MDERTADGLRQLSRSGAVRSGRGRSASWRRGGPVLLGVVGLVLYCAGLFLPLVTLPPISADIGAEPAIIDLGNAAIGFWLANPNVWIVALGLGLVCIGLFFVTRRDSRMGRSFIVIGGLIGFALFAGHVPVSTWRDLEGGTGLWLGLSGSSLIVVAGLALKRPRS